MKALKTIGLALAAMLVLSPAAAEAAQPASVQAISSMAAAGRIVSISGATFDQSTGDVTFTAAGQSVVIDAAGAGGFSLLAGGTFTGNVEILSSDKPSSGFVGMEAASAAAPTTTSPNITAAGQYFGNPLGRYIELTTTSWTSGSVTITPMLHAQRFPSYASAGTITGSVTATSTATATANAPTYTEGQTDAAPSVDLSGYMRTRAKQDGPWNVGITGTLPDFATPPAVTMGDGALATLGLKADGACATDTGACSTQEMLKRMAQQLTTLQGKVDTLTTAVNSAIPASSADTLIGGAALYLGSSKVNAGQAAKSASVPVTMASDQTPGPGSASLVTAQVSVGTSATQIAAARTGRNSVTVVNGTTNDIYLGGAGVTTSTGILLVGIKGAAVTLPFSGAVYGVSSATSAVSVAENY